MASTGERPVVLLQEDNYLEWKRDIRAVLRGIGALGIVDGTNTAPTPTKEGGQSELEKWRALSDKAAGLILRSLSSNQYVFVNEEDSPSVMWTKLEAAHNKKLPAVRFNAYNELFNIRKSSDESLTSLMTRIDKATMRIKSLRPADYSLAKLDDELAALALLRALPESDSVWTSSLLMGDDITYDKVKTSFATQENLQKSRGEESAAKAYAQSSSICTFCGAQFHTEETCFAKQNASKAAKEKVRQQYQEGTPSSPNKSTNKGHKKKKKKENSAAIAQADEKEEETANASNLDVTSPLCALIVEASSDWTADTGASSHMTPHRHWFATYKPHVIPIRLADGKVVMSAGIGSVKFQPSDVKGHTLQFERVLHVPSLRSNLLSVLYLTTKKGYVVKIEQSTMHFYRNDSLLFTATVNHTNTALLNGVTLPMTEFAGLASSSTCPLDTSLWHRRFGHLNIADVKKLLSKNLVSGMDVVKSQHHFDPICEPCLDGKQARHINKVATTHYTEPLALIHSDLHGPLKVQTPEGFRYWVTFIDDATRYCSIALLKKKSDVFTAFKQFKPLVENLVGHKIKILRDDKGGEYMSIEFDKYLTANGIARQHTVRNSPHQNGVAERFNRTLAEGTISLLSEAKLPQSFWGHAVITTVYVRNRSPTSALGGKVPYTLFYGKKPDVAHLRVFGCTAYVHVQKDQRSGLSPHTQKCVFIGYPAGYKGWMFYNPLTKKTLISDSVTFDERAFPGLSKTPVIEENSPYDFLLVDDTTVPSQVGVVPDQVGVLPGLIGDELDQVGDSENSAPVSPSPQSSPSPSPSPSPAPSPVASPTPPPVPPVTSKGKAKVVPTQPVRRSTRKRQPPQQYWTSTRLNQYREPTPAIPSSDEESEVEEQVVDESDQSEPIEPLDDDDDGAELSYDEEVGYLSVPDAFEIAYKAAAHDDSPKSLAEALRSPDADKWYDAAYQEIKALVDNGTWMLAKLPPGRKPIGGRWVFVVKRKKDGSVDKFKARFVAKGYAQRPGFDYTDTFAPTARWAALRSIFALAAFEDMELESLDISNAFLNGDLEEEVYIEQPEGFHQGAKDEFLRLLKGLYGLKQSPRIWHKKLHKVLVGLGFKQVRCDHSIWVYEKDGMRIILPVFVDDMTIASKSKKAIEELKNELRKHFKFHDLGPTTYLLGVGVDRDRAKRSITLSQQKYTLDVLKRYKMETCTPVGTPMLPGLKLGKHQAPTTPEEIEYMKNVPYINAVGSLMYLAIATRPDIAYTVGVLARFSANPGIQHWKAVKHVLRYLKGTANYGITYSPTSGNPTSFITYSDADHGGNPDSLKSTGAYVVKMGTGAVDWQSKLQTIVALSTTEAEYLSAVTAGQTMLWYRNLFEELGYKPTEPSVLCIDNQSAIAVAKDPEHHGRMKHLDLRTYWLRQTVDEKKIAVQHLPITEMPADLLTKVLSKPKVEYLRALFGLGPC